MIPSQKVIEPAKAIPITPAIELVNAMSIFLSVMGAKATGKTPASQGHSSAFDCGKGAALAEASTQLILLPRRTNSSRKSGWVSIESTQQTKLDDGFTQKSSSDWGSGG